MCVMPFAFVVVAVLAAAVAAGEVVIFRLFEVSFGFGAEFRNLVRSHTMVSLGPRPARSRPNECPHRRPKLTDPRPQN